VTRLLRIVVHNWPLKLAAVGLATLLYGGLVISQSTTTFDDAVIPVRTVNQPPNTYIINNIDPVTEVRYFSPSGRRAVASTFRAEVDLSDVPVGAGPQLVPVTLDSIDNDISVVSFTPDRVTVELDSLETRVVPVEVRHDPPPAGIAIGTETVEPQTVTVSGPKSMIDTITAARGDVVIQPNAISIDQDVPLVPVDAQGNTVSPATVDPDVAHVSIPVFQDLRTKTLPVTPITTGAPAPGFEVASITVDPLAVTISGDAEVLADLPAIETEPISLNGASATVTTDAPLAMPSGTEPVDVDAVQVVVTLRPVTATRNFEAGLELTGARADLRYATSTDRVQLTLGGSTADLDRLSGANIVAELDVAGLDIGTSDVPVTVDLPAGVTLVAASPATVTVTITAPPAPTPSAAAPPTPTPVP
jgi:YbbR domain-containing protein